MTSTQASRTAKKLGLFHWRWSHTGFGGINSHAPKRQIGREFEFDHFDYFFSSQEEFARYKKKIEVELSQLDEPLNYCQFFIRENGNDGVYERDGKVCKVNGLWCGYDIWDNQLFPSLDFDYKQIDVFRKFLTNNGWNESNWWKLHGRYVPVLDWIVEEPTLKIGESIYV